MAPPTALPPTRTLLLVALAAGGSTPAVTAEWTLTPEAQSMVDYSSNRLLQARAVPGEQLFVLADLSVQRATALSALAAHARASLQRFTGNSSADANNGGLDLSTRLVSERSAYAFSAGLARDSVLATQLSDQGLFSTGTTRVRGTGSGSWTYSYAPRWQLSLSAGLEDTHYNSAAGVRLQAYRYPSATASVRHNISELGSVGLTLNAAQLDNTLSNQTTNDATATIDFGRDITSRTALSLHTGYSSERGPTRSTAGFVASLQLTTQSDRTQWSLSLSRSATPDGNGQLVQREELSAALSYSLSPRLVLLFNLGAVKDADLGLTAQAAALGRTQLAAQAGLRWQLNETWSTDLRLTGQRYEQSQGRQSSDHGLALSFHWKPIPWAVSR